MTTRVGDQGWRRHLAITGEAVTHGPFWMTSLSSVGTCALAPAYVIRWHLGPVPTTILENAILVTIALFIYESIRQRTRPAWRTAMLVPAILFLVAGAISVVVAPDHRAALGLYRAYLIEPMAFALVLINVVTTPQRALAVVGGLALGALVAGVPNSVVVIQALRHHAYDVVNTPPVVIYNTANAVALYLGPVLAMAGAVALHWEGRRERWIAVGVLALGGVCMVLSFSRGGYLAIFVAAVGLALSHRRRWWLLLGGAATAGALMLVPLLRRRVLTELDWTNGSNTLVRRFHLWGVALQMLRDHPIFGAGLSGYATVVGPYWNPFNADRFTYPHNILLNFWTETGLLGVAAFASILGVTIVHAWRGWHRSGPAWRAIHLGVLLALVAVIVHGLVDVPYWKNDLSLELWTLVGLTFAVAAIGPTTAGGSAAKTSP